MNTLKKVSSFFVFYVITWVVLWIPFRYYTPLALRPLHTYQLPAANCTNTLVSDLNAFESVREGLMVIYILVPFSVCLMMWAKEIHTWRIHMLVLIFSFIWGLINFSYDISDLAYANVPPNDPNFRPQNLARDNRWCLYWGGQVGTELLCANSGPCSLGSAIDPESFSTNGPFNTRFVFNMLIVIKVVVDVWASLKWKKLLSPLPPPPAPEEPIKARYQPRKKL
jgi:hypothetical protein